MEDRNIVIEEAAKLVEGAPLVYCEKSHDVAMIVRRELADRIRKLKDRPMK